MCSAKFEKMMDWLAGVYVNAMNIIHYMHDKYAYERVEMALHDYAPLRTMAFGMAGMSVVADSLSAIRYAKVRVVRDATGLVTDYQTEGTFPFFGNNDNRVDQLAVVAGQHLHEQTAKVPDLSQRDPHTVGSDHHLERRVWQGRPATRLMDAGVASRLRQAPIPMHGRDSHGIHAAAASVAKIPYRDAADGISLTTSLVPTGLGRIAEDRIANLTAHARRVLQHHRLSHERQRAESRHAPGCHGSPGKVSQSDDPRVRLRGQFRAAHARAADGCHQPDVPWNGGPGCTSPTKIKSINDERHA